MNVSPSTRSRSIACWARPLVGLIALLLAACDPAPPKMDESETKHMSELLANLSPRCVGRHLLDMPQGLVLNSESATEVDGVKIEVKPLTRHLFDLTLKSREAELRNEHQDGEPDVPHLKAVISLPEPAVGVIFNRAETFGAADSSRTLELLGWKKGFVVRMQLNAHDVNAPVYRNDPTYRNFKTDTPEKLARLRQVFQRVRGRPDNETPTEAGLCIKDGFVQGAPGDKESTTAFYHLKDSQDVYFRVYSDSGLVQGTSLLERGARIEAFLKNQEGRTLRSGRRESGAGVSFEEWLMALTTNDRIPGNDFLLEVNSKTATARTPLVMVELYNGYRIPGPTLTNEESAVRPDLTKATLTDAEAVGLWDKVTSTLRVRPGAL